MSDHRPDPHSDLTPAQDDTVRALLASARHTAPTPPDVVARLEATLASLSDERREPSAPVVTLASRRRRTAATLLLAAAAVVVAGVGIGQVLPSGTSDDSAGSAESATSAEDQSAAQDREFSGSPGADAELGELQGDTDMRAQESAPAPSALARYGALDGGAALKPQVRKLRRLAATSSSFSADPACPLPDLGDGTLVSVTYNGLPGALVFRAPVTGTQQVDVFVCGETGARRSLQLPAP